MLEYTMAQASVARMPGHISLPETHVTSTCRAWRSAPLGCSPPASWSCGSAPPAAGPAPPPPPSVPLPAASCVANLHLSTGDIAPK